MTFKSGDKCVVTGNRHFGHYLDIGSTVVVEHSYSDGEGFSVKGRRADGEDLWQTIHKEDLKLATEKVLDTKPKKLYAVIHQPSSIVAKTFDTRREARKFKAALGGKENGVAIIAFKAVKEIR